MITEFLGRFHPLVVHLPIGIYVLLYLLQYFSPRRVREQKEVFSLMLLLGFFFSILAVVLGWLLSDSGDYTEEAVFSHKWSGIAFMVAGGLLYCLHSWAPESSLTKKLYHVALHGVMILMTIAGHFGGNLTHGEGYLFSSFDQNQRSASSETENRKAPVTDPATATVFASVVEPVLVAKCNQCHNEKKKKGSFRMDEFELLMKGGKSGAAIIPGNAMNSELVKRMLLPLEDDKHMPPKGKKQLTEKEIALIQWWIGHGADRSARVNDVATNDTLKSFLGAAEKNAEPEADSLPLVSKPDSLAVLTLKKAGFSVNPIAVGSGLLHVSAVNMPSLGADQLKLIAPLAKNIYWLELADQNINDQMLSFVSSCLNLNRLDLKNTQVTGRISSDLVKLPALEYVNLVGTDFDDAGLNGLEGMKSLKHLYCWGSRVTNSGAVQFEKTNGTVKVDLGINKK